MADNPKLADKTLDTIVPDQLWSVSHEVRLLPGVYLPARMVVIRLDAERLALHSPVPMNDSLAARIDALGKVSVLIAPNDYHHLYLPKTVSRYPTAEVWGAPGLPKKRPDVTFTALFGPNAAPTWADRLTPYFLAGGPKANETVFVHQATRTLLVTDSYFNLTRARTAMSRFMFRLTGSLNKPGQSLIWRSVVKDRAAMLESTERVLAADFDRLVMAHGDILESGARAAYEAATRWLVRKR